MVHVAVPFQILKKCGHFQWIYAYVDRLRLEESIGATQELNLGGGGALAVENAADRGAVPNADLMELKGELKKINKHLRQQIDLKKQANLMAGGFFVV